MRSILVYDNHMATESENKLSASPLSLSCSLLLLFAVPHYSPPPTGQISGCQTCERPKRAGNSSPPSKEWAEVNLFHLSHQRNWNLFLSCVCREKCPHFPCDLLLAHTLSLGETALFSCWYYSARWIIQLFYQLHIQCIQTSTLESSRRCKLTVSTKLIIILWKQPSPDLQCWQKTRHKPQPPLSPITHIYPVTSATSQTPLQPSHTSASPLPSAKPCLLSPGLI